MKATVVEGVDVGTTLPPMTMRFTRERLVRYAGASTDFNPIHYSEYFATRMGLPGVSLTGCSPWELRFESSPTGRGPKPGDLLRRPVHQAGGCTR